MPIWLRIASGPLVDVDTNGAVTTNTTATPNWGFGVYNSFNMPQFNGYYLLCAVCGGGVKAPLQPSLGILGPGGGTSSTPYSTANNSIKDNGPHNPFFDRRATYTFTGPTITADTLASNVFFSFGTAFGEEIPSDVPEPVTLTLTGAALIGLAVGTRKRRAS